MEARSTLKTIAFKDVTDKKDVTVTGLGKYFIGLSKTGDVAIGREVYDLCVSLLCVTIQENGGCVLGLANTDFACIVNLVEELTGEINLVDGMKLEIADRVLLFIDGPVPKRRRKLPQTPGTVVGAPPAKPSRASDKQKKSSINGENGENVEEVTEDQKWLDTSWCMLELSPNDKEMFSDLQTPEQISILAASYFTKQLRMFTDAVITTKLLDDIFKLFMDTVEYCTDTYLGYLAEVSRALAKVPDRSNTPMHGPAVRFITELLRHILDPVERVILLMDLIRTFSHFDCNLVTMVRCQATATVLGSMSAYLDVVEVQRYGSDILAKIAIYKPNLDQKAPLREVAVDMLVRGVKHHSKDLALSRSVCRVLANISSTLITILNHWLDSDSIANCNVIADVEKYEALLLYTFQEGIPIVQTILKNFSSDLGVSTEGRKFIFFYAKLPQLQLKRSTWKKQMEKQLQQSSIDISDESMSYQSDDHDVTVLPGQLLSRETREEETQSILKTRGTYENQRSNERKIVFADDTVGGSDSEMPSSSESGTDSDVSFDGNIVMNEETEDFSTHVVHHFVKKTMRLRSHEENDADSEESDSDQEFLQSLNVQSPNVKCDSPTPVESVLDLQTPASNAETDRPKFVKSPSGGANSNKDELIVQNSSHADGNTGEMDNSKKENGTTKKNNSTLENTGVGMVSKDKTVEDINDSATEVKIKDMQQSTYKNSALLDVTFLGKLVRTQIIVYVGTLVFQGEDSKVLMVIDQPIGALLESAGAPSGLVEFAGNQYGASMTLMDLEPAMVISVIDAVRYRSVTQELVQSGVLSLTRVISSNLQPSTIDLVMLFYKTLFADEHLAEILKEEKFCEEFRLCFQKATERMDKTYTLEEIRKTLAESF